MISTRTTRLGGAMALALGAILLAGCGGGGTTPAAPPVAGSTIPASFFTTERPADAPDLAAVRTTATVGDTVTFLARVGGRSKPFVDGLAMFVVADPALKSCEIISVDDHCPVPWDYCCEDPGKLTAGLATVRLLGQDGREIPVTAQGVGGLDALHYVVVEGVVSAAGDAFVVDANRIWVGGKPTFAAPRDGSGA